MINRREFIGIAAGAGATLALTPDWLRALQQSQGKLIQRAIPSSAEMLPIISYAPRPTVRTSGPGPIQAAPTDVPAAREVLKVFLDKGGKVVDVLHGGPPAENAARAAATELGIQNKFFWTTPLGVNVPVLPGFQGPPPSPQPASIRAALEEKLAALKVPKIDLVMVGTGGDVKTHLTVLQEMKKEGKVRYIGVHHLAFPANAPMPTFGPLESIMRNEQIDFIGTDYSAGDRRLEEKLLPLALERKIGVMAYFPFDRRRIFERASSTPLPEWAAEFDAKTWAQFFIKYVASHPAVTVVRTGTTKAEHMLDNLAGGMGRLPDEAMRKRMAALVDTFPPTPVPAPVNMQMPGGPPANQAAPLVLAAEVLDRYVGEYVYPAANQGVTIRRDGERLMMKIQGGFPEGPIIPRAETRFQGPVGLMLEFQTDSQGKVTGATVLQGPNRIPLVRR
jgi:aryl-alcohol dehydrogenase-like predicted oxidoreductase